MAKTPKTSFKLGPWTLKNKAIDDFMRVTANNRKQAVVQGRIMYVISGKGNPYQYCGFFTIDPCFTKGWWKMPFPPYMLPSAGLTHWKCYIDTDIIKTKWAHDFNMLITKHIANEELYILPNDPILTYFKDK